MSRFWKDWVYRLSNNSMDIDDDNDYDALKCTDQSVVGREYSS